MPVIVWPVNNMKWGLNFYVQDSRRGWHQHLRHLRGVGPSDNTSQIVIVGTILKPLVRFMVHEWFTRLARFMVQWYMSGLLALPALWYNGTCVVYSPRGFKMGANNHDLWHMCGLLAGGGRPSEHATVVGVCRVLHRVWQEVCRLCVVES